MKNVRRGALLLLAACSSRPSHESPAEGIYAPADCHVPSLSGPRGPVPAFTDLLLHDMGEELADGVTMGDAKGNEFRTAPLLHDVAPLDYVGIGQGLADGRELRTPPLWGLAESAPYMHDASASTIEAALALHESEALASRQAFEQLSAEDRADLLLFLGSL